MDTIGEEIRFEPFVDLADSTTMTTLTDYNPARAIAHSKAGYFYFYMALACTAVAFLGFAPTYWMPLANRSFSASPVIHFHGLLFFAWSLYLAVQSGDAPDGTLARVLSGYDTEWGCATRMSDTALVMAKFL